MNKVLRDIREEEKMSKFENCISLGWYCGTATSMAYYGLRSCSGPFDWYNSNLEDVLKSIDNDFSDFMIKENLIILEKNDKKILFDRKNNFDFPHEIKDSYISEELEIIKIVKKYHKRINRFKKMIYRKTCFIRIVRSNDEIFYINEYKKYIYSVIKKYNHENEIIFLVPQNSVILDNDILYFRLNVEDYNKIKPYDRMARLFTESKQFMQYCNMNFETEIIKKNINFDKMIEMRSLVVHHIMARMDDSLYKVIIKFFEHIEDGIYLWGYGYNGIPVVSYLLAYGIRINGIIDNNREKVGIKYQDIDVILLDSVKEKHINIFITISSKIQADFIVEQINNTLLDISYLLWNDLYLFL